MMHGVNNIKKVTVQLYLIFRYLKTLTTSRYSCICARSL